MKATVLIVLALVLLASGCMCCCCGGPSGPDYYDYDYSVGDVSPEYGSQTPSADLGNSD